MRLSTVILPIYRWHEQGRVPFRDGTWFGAVPTLTAATTATEQIRIGRW